MDVIDADWIRLRLTNRHGELKALADAVGLTPDKITKILKGQRQIKAHEATKFAAFLAPGPTGFDEAPAAFQAQAVPVAPTGRLQALFAALCPRSPKSEAYRVKEAILAAGLLAGDLLVVELGMTAAPGDLVLVTIADTDRDTQRTVIRKFWPPLVVPIAPTDTLPALSLSAGQSVAVLATVKAVARADDLF